MHLRLRETRNFQLSGFDDSERTKLVSYISHLKGQCFETKEYVGDTSHIIIAKPTRSEKYLCGCAAGKWILTKEYILRSHKVGQWLNEADFELGNPATKYPSSDLVISRPPKYWREFKERTGKGPFSGWIVALAIENLQRRPVVYKRLLQTGGAKVVNLAIAKAMELTHLIADRTNKNIAKPFAKAGVACVEPSYLAEVLLQEYPKIDKYLAFDVSLFSPELNNNTIVTKDRDSLRSDSKNSTTKDAAFSSSPKTSVESSQKLCVQIAKLKQEPISPVKHVKAVNKCKDTLRSRSKNSKTKDATCCLAMSTITSRKKLQRVPKVKKEAASPVKNLKAEIMPRNTKDLMYTLEKAQSGGIKRKLIFTECDVGEALHNLKKIKIETPSYTMVPYWMQILPKQGVQNKTCPVPFNHLTCNLIEGSIEEKEWFGAVEDCKIHISTNQYPPPRLLNLFMKEMLVTSSWTLAQAISHLLKTCLCLHPPSAFLSLPNMYLESFCTERVLEKSTSYICSDAPWDFVSHVISRVIGETRNDVEERGHSLLLLHYIVALFEQDFRAHCDRWKNKDKFDRSEKSMMAKLLWPRGPVKATSPNIRRLMYFLVQALIKSSDVHSGGESSRSSGVHCSDSTSLCSNVHCSGDASLCLRLLQTLFSLAAECCRLDDVTDPETISSGLVSEGLAVDLLTEMVSRLKQYNLTKINCLSLYLDTLTLQWMKTLSLTAMLSWYDDTLVANRKMKAGKLCLAKIVNWYFYLLPQMPAVTSPVKKTPTKNSPILTRVKSVLKVNKRNGKGETSLQIAAIKGHLGKVKELLAVPGINVNSQDNAGWTALHEACNKGYTAIVRELLKFRPTRTITHYFNNNNSQKADCNGLDLLLAPPCGTTALHDAVINNRLEIAHLLLQHGGRKLLVANRDGYTPLDFAVKSEMKTMLLTFDKENNNDKELPPTSLKDFQSRIPDDEAYRVVLGEPAIHIETDKCATFAFLIQQLLTTYVISNRLQEVKQEVDFALSRMRCNKDTMRPLESGTNGRTSAVSVAVKPSDLASFLGQTNEHRLVEDLKVYSKIHEHLENFDKHLAKISNDSNTSLSELLGLKWSIALQVIGGRLE